MGYSILIISVISLAAGFFLGKYIGEGQGFKEGILLTPLMLRKKSLEEGKCLLCNNDFENNYYKQEKNT